MDGLNINGIEMPARHGYFVLLWDVASGHEVRRFAGLSDNIGCVTFSPDGTVLGASSRDGRIALWEAGSGKDLLYIMAHPHGEHSRGGCPALAFLPDGKSLASAGGDGTIRLWSTVTARELGRLLGPEGGFHALALAQGGQRLVSGGADSTVLIWERQAATPAVPGKRDAILIGD